MDFKGITWVGNVYQKFEAMCLEVEEIIVQDTAKYVENQVQTVGNSLKKFCSDVAQDFKPDDDTVDSGKALPVSMLHEYAPVCSFKKKKRDGMNQQQTRDAKQEQEGKKNVCEMKFRGVDADDYDICTSPRQYSYGSPYRRTRLSSRKQVSKKEDPFQVTTRPWVQRDSSSLSMVHRARVRDDVGTVKSSDFPPSGVARPISKEECQKDDRRGNQHGLTVIDSVRSRETNTRTGDQHGLAVVNPVRSEDSETRTGNDHGLTVVNLARSQDTEARADNELSSAVVNSVSSQDSEIQPSVATSLPACSDDCRKETDEDSMQTKTSSSSVSESEQKAEILQQLRGRSVEESCIIVDREDLHCVFPDRRKENDRHKPYKKIRDAISSRMKQNREKEYKRLARQWYAEDVENGRECGDGLKQIEEDQSPEESEWELL